jgi:nitroreductase
MDYQRKLQFIFHRRSIRKYTDQKVNEEMIRVILKAAMSAPSAVAKDPWRFIVVTSKEKLKEISNGLPNGQMLANASVGIVVCGDITAAHGNELSYMLQDCSAAIENALLAAGEIGLGAVWLGIHPCEGRIEHIRNLFKLPKNIIPVSCLSIGYPAEQKASGNRYNENYVHWEKW